MPDDRSDGDVRPNAPLARPFVPSLEPPQGSGGGSTGSRPVLRPYLLTSGRVRPSDESLQIETQVVATAPGQSALHGLTFEYRDIVGLCAEPQSIAEIAALLGLHLGVVRVLVGDLAAQNYLAVSAAPLEAAQDVEMLRRVLRGLQSLT